MILFAAPAEFAAGKRSSGLATTRTGNAPAMSALEGLRAAAPSTAEALNAALPLSMLPNPAAAPFVLARGNAVDRERATVCLASAIYYEAATEPIDGQRAVAQVVLNRLRDPAFPKTVCGVVYQGSERTTGCQFTFTCDGSLARAPVALYWNRARQVAEQALAGSVYKAVGRATHYHTDWVVPYWSSSLVKVAVVGSHIFYRWKGDWGAGLSFARYAGMEPDVAERGKRLGFGVPVAGLAAAPGPATGTGGLLQAALERQAAASPRLRWTLTAPGRSEDPGLAGTAPSQTRTADASLGDGPAIAGTSM